MTAVVCTVGTICIALTHIYQYLVNLSDVTVETNTVTVLVKAVSFFK